MSSNPAYPSLVSEVYDAAAPSLKKIPVDDIILNGDTSNCPFVKCRFPSEDGTNSCDTSYSGYPTTRGLRIDFISNKWIIEIDQKPRGTEKYIVCLKCFNGALLYTHKYFSYQLQGLCGQSIF